MAVHRASGAMTRTYWAAFAVQLLALPAMAQEAAPHEQPQPESATVVPEVVVEGRLPDVSNRIDRQVYRVEGDPQAESSNVLEILGNLPSVTVTPAGQVRLLGQGGVTIMVDGRVPPNPDAVLRALSGVEIARIEVMTNPSARSVPTGSAGIINIITRRRFAVGLSGVLSGQIDTLNGHQVTVSPAYTRGRLSLNGSIGQTRSHVEGEASRRRVSGLGETLEARRHETDADTWTGNARIAYQLNDDDALSLTINTLDTRSRAEAEGDLRLGGPSGSAILERQAERLEFGAQDATLEYQGSGPREEGSVSGALSIGSSQWNLASVLSDDSSGTMAVRYFVASLIRDETAALNIDYERPMDGDRQLSLGARWERLDTHVRQAFEAVPGGRDIGPDFAAELAGVRDVASAYVTIQFERGAWTFLPGLRGEHERMRLQTDSTPSHTSDFRWFPSVHAEREISETLRLRLSYSRRIERPLISLLSPGLSYTGTLAASGGNPHLRPATTHAWEVRLEREGQQHQASLTFYRRQLVDAWAQFTELRSDDVSVTTPINNGEVLTQGIETSFRGDLGDHIAYSASLNLSVREQLERNQGVAISRTSFAQSGNAQIRYVESTTPDPGVDQYQFSVRYIGPQRMLQGETSAYAAMDFVWRHYWTESVSSVFSIINIFDRRASASEVVGVDFREELLSEGSGRYVRLSLTYRFGARP